MKWLALALALVLVPAAAQEKKPPAKKAHKMPPGKAHSKPTPEQIRKFDRLEKKQGK